MKPASSLLLCDHHRRDFFVRGLRNHLFLYQIGLGLVGTIVDNFLRIDVAYSRKYRELFLCGRIQINQLFRRTGRRGLRTGLLIRGFCFSLRRCWSCCSRDSRRSADSAVRSSSEHGEERGSRTSGDGQSSCKYCSTVRGCSDQDPRQSSRRPAHGSLPAPPRRRSAVHPG